jgi:hypothetical protein
LNKDLCTPWEEEEEEGGGRRRRTETDQVIQTLVTN